MNATAAKHTTAADPMTGPQKNFLDKLISQRDLGDAREKITEMVNTPTTTRAEASFLIDWMKSMPWLPKDQAALPGTDGVQRESFTLEDGMYNYERSIYKVQHAIHGSGNQYAKRLELSEPDCGDCANGDTENCVEVFGHPCAWGVSFVYAPGVVRNLRPEMRMSAEQAKEFGALYGTCANCGKTLTDEDSIARGYGPVCAKKFL